MSHPQKGYLNIYRSGWFHRAGKPETFDRHGGDIYPTEAAALAAIAPHSHYITTIPISWDDPEALSLNPPTSIPISLHTTRRLTHA